jgi:hypothetical protein
MYSRRIIVLAVLLCLTTLTVAASTVEADSDQNVGILKVSVSFPSFVSPSSQVSLLIDNNYAVHDNATLQTRLFNGTLAHLGTELWHSEPYFINGPILGEQILTANLTAPTTNGSWKLTAVTYFQNVGKYNYNDTTTNEPSAWSYYNDTEYGPSFLQFTVEISDPAQIEVDLGIPSVPVTVNNAQTETASNGSARFQLHVGENATVSVPPVLPLENSTRLVFQGWQGAGNSTGRSLLLEGSSKLTGEYRVQYLLTVDSVVPTYAQSTWHNPGSAVILEAPNSAPMAWPLGALGLRYAFRGWTGAVTSNSNSISLIMDKPKIVKADYAPDLAPLTLPSIILAGVIVGASYTIVQRRSASNGFGGPRREEHGTEESFEKTCGSCGGKAKEDWVYCTKCGQTLAESSEPIDQKN